MHQSPKVTVALPVYNGEEFVAQSIKSLLAQDYENKEIVIVDDVSTDKTVEICRYYSDRYEEISFCVNTRNLGGNGNFRQILERCDSEYIVWASQDDYWHPKFISSLVAKLDRDQNLSIAGSNVVLIEPNGVATLSFAGKWDPEFLTRYWLVWALIVPVSSSGWLKTNLFIHGVVRTRILKECFQLLIGEGGHDRVYILFSILKGGWGYLNENLYFRRKNTGLELRESKPKDQILEAQFLIAAPIINGLKMSWGVFLIKDVSRSLRLFTFFCIVLYIIFSYLSILKRALRFVMKLVLPNSVFESAQTVYRKLLSIK